MLPDSDADEAGLLEGDDHGKDPFEGSGQEKLPVSSHVKEKGVPSRDRTSSSNSSDKGHKFYNGEKEHVPGDGHGVNEALQGSSQYYSGTYDSSPYETPSNSYFSAYSDSDNDSDSDDAVVEYTVCEMARLLSLNEQDMINSDSGDEGTVEEAAAKKVGSSSKRPSKLKKHIAVVGSSSSSSNEEPKKTTTSTHKIRLEPVGVFWDIENCPVPMDKSAFGVASKMRREFITGKREAEFMCVCDITKERKEVTDDLHMAQVKFFVAWPTDKQNGRGGGEG